MVKKMILHGWILTILLLGVSSYASEQPDVKFLSGGKITGFYSWVTGQSYLGLNLAIADWKEGLASINLGGYIKEAEQIMTLGLDFNTHKLCDLIKLDYKLPVDIGIGGFIPLADLPNIFSGKPVNWGVTFTVINIPLDKLLK